MIISEKVVPPFVPEAEVAGPGDPRFFDEVPMYLDISDAADGGLIDSAAEVDLEMEALYHRIVEGEED